MDWTHKNVLITDIRKISNLFVISVDDKTITSSLMINEKIFNERLRSYFLKEPNKITREEILSVNWNFYITKGYYIKIQPDSDNFKRFDQDENKFYVSYLEIAGELSSFQSVYKQSKEQIN